MWNFLAHLLIYATSLPENVHLPKRLRKSLKIYFQFSEHRFELGIILKDFSSSTILVTQIQVSFARVEIPKNPGIQPSYSNCELTCNGTHKSL